ncbi:MAG: hypothetical protein K9G49_03965 [Taibaiella sp.]|nr:hypothetical protein [Taibaiella sp.]
MNLYSRIVFVIVIFFCPLRLYGETDTVNSIIRPLYVRVAPLSAMDYYGAILPVGIEYRFRKRTSVIAEVGVPLFFYGIRSNITSHTKISSDVKFRTELRFYRKTKGPESPFWGIEGFTRSQVLFQRDSYFRRLSGNGRIETNRFSNATTHKTVSGGGFICGGRKQIGRRFSREIYIGLGLRYLSATHSNVESVYVGTNELEGFPGFEQNHMEGNTIKIYIPCGLKFSYAIVGN